VTAVASQQSLSDGSLPSRAWPAQTDVLAHAGGENFPVAMRWLPRSDRAGLLAIYGFARLTDDLGDEWSGDRLAALDWLESDLDGAMAGRSAHPSVAAAAEMVRGLGIRDQPLRDLIEANRQDQRVERYATFDDLEAYCRLSANPVGRLVLAVFGASTPEHMAWSDAICTGLQLAEHWQDVAEDAAAGRIYLPSVDLDRFGVDAGQLRATTSSPELRALMAFEVARARVWLDAGLPLVRSLKGRHRLAVAGFVAGGHAALDAIAGADFEVLAATRRPTAFGFGRRLLGLTLDHGAVGQGGSHGG
jgi:squalene synthase HpnC